jgi:hypothetical protein
MWRDEDDSFRKFLKSQSLMWLCDEKRASINWAKTLRHEDWWNEISKNEWQKTKTRKIYIFCSQIKHRLDIRHSRHSNIVKTVYFTVRHSDIFYFIVLLILLLLHRLISYDFINCRTSSIHHAHLNESISWRWRLWLD